MKGQFSTIIKVLKYVKKYSFFIIVSLICATITVIFSLYLPILTGQAIDLIVGKGQVDFDGIIKILSKMVIYIGISALASWIMNIANNKIVYNTIGDIRKDAFGKIQRIAFPSSPAPPAWAPPR